MRFPTVSEFVAGGLTVLIFGWVLKKVFVEPARESGLAEYVASSAKTYPFEEADDRAVLDAILDEFEQNSVDAEGHYKGKILFFDAKINSIDSDSLNNRNVDVSLSRPGPWRPLLGCEGIDCIKNKVSEYEHAEIIARCSNKLTDPGIRSLRKGDTLYVAGKFDEQSFTNTLLFKGCSYYTDRPGEGYRRIGVDERPV